MDRTELDNAIRMMKAEVDWLQEDLERAGRYKTMALKTGIINGLVTPAMRRLNQQVEFVKRLELEG